MRTLSIIIAITLLALGGCSEGLPPRQQVDELRVLGLRLSPPSATPGQEVVADALVVNPSEQEIKLEWYACLAPISPNAYFTQSIDNDDCPLGESPHGLSLGEGESASFEVPANFMEQVSDVLTEAGFESDEGEMSEAIQGLLAISGWYLQVTLIATSGEQEEIMVKKRLVVTLFADQNDNPAPPTFVLEEVAEEGSPAPLIQNAEPGSESSCLSPESPLNSLQDGVYRLSPVNLPDPPPTYPVLDFGGEVTEREETLFYSWFSTVEKITAPVTKSPDEHPVGIDIDDVDPDTLVNDAQGRASIPIWVVVRDGRGGTSWCHELLPYTPSSR